jgi:hypothetical protein
MRHVSCMIHVIKRGFLIGARSDFLGGLSQHHHWQVVMMELILVDSHCHSVRHEGPPMSSY